MNEQQLAPTSPCPDWCVGGDHEELVAGGALYGEEPEHFALVANGVGWSVDLARNVGGGRAYVTLHADDHSVTATTDRARSLGAALIRAADLAQRDGCA